jgi:hypothetical protein
MRHVMRVTAGRVDIGKNTYAAMIPQICQSAAIQLTTIIFSKDYCNDKLLASLDSFSLGGARVGALAV